MKPSLFPWRGSKNHRQTWIHLNISILSPRGKERSLGRLELVPGKRGKSPFDISKCWYLNFGSLVCRVSLGRVVSKYSRWSIIAVDLYHGTLSPVHSLLFQNSIHHPHRTDVPLSPHHHPLQPPPPPRLTIPADRH